MFKITMNKGFQLTFDNGYTISVQFGHGNYCENYSNTEYYPCNKEIIVTSADAEIAIWHENDGEFITDKVLADMGYPEIFDAVKGYVSANDVAKIIGNLVTYPFKGDC